MTTPPRPPPPQTLSPNLPINWSGGTFEGHLAPLTEDWYAEERTALERVLEMTDWAPLEPLTEGDPPESWGSIDLGGGGAGATPRQTEARSGAVVRISASGLVLDDHDQWLNVSRFGPPVDLRPVRVGDVCVCEVEVGLGGRRYLRRLRVIPLDEPHAGAPPDAETHGTPETEHIRPEGGGR